jgi:hypothetical protein
LREGFFYKALIVFCRFLIPHRNGHKVLIAEMNEERKNLKEQLAGIAPPEKLTKKQRKLWDYMRLHPEVTEFSTLAKRTGLARNTVKKHYGAVVAMLGVDRE